MAQPALPVGDLALVLERAQAPLRRLDGAHVLIAGASGLVGSWLLESLLDAQRTMMIDVSATLLVRNTGAFAAAFPHLAASPRVTMAEGDVRTFADPARGPTHVIHAASADTPARNVAAPDDVSEMIGRGTEHLLDYAERAGAARILLVSSGSVYVRQARPITEIDPTLARGDTVAERFGVAKRNAERLGESMSAARGVTIARIFTLFGPRLPISGQFAVGQFLGDALAGRPVRVRGDGTPLRSYLYLADLAAWCWHLLDRGGEPRVYNVGADFPVSIGGVAAKVGALSDAHVQPAFGANPVPGALPPCYLPSVTRAREELGLEAWTSLDDGLARTWAWLNSDTR